MAKYDVAAYFAPIWTGNEKRARIFWPEGMGEWESVRSAESKFPGHHWPRKPLWGYINEADPYIMSMEIEAATDHGVNVFIFDWYWYDRRPFLETTLNDGFLKASNNQKMKFYLMWANHDWIQLFDKRNSTEDSDTVIWKGGLDFEEFKQAMTHVIKDYFTRPNYYTIDGKPVIMIYDVPTLVKGFGSIELTKEALAWFRSECEKAGFPGLHLQFTMWKEDYINLSGVDGERNVPVEQFTSLGFDSTTHYQYAHFINIDRDYADVLDDVKAEWERIDRKCDFPYFPHVSMGWDNNPRFTSVRSGILRNGTPEIIEKALEMAKEYTDNHPNQPPLVVINSWNEWTESSYLQPDDLHAYGYLEAIRNVFKQAE